MMASSNLLAGYFLETFLPFSINASARPLQQLEQLLNGHYPDSSEALQFEKIPVSGYDKAGSPIESHKDDYIVLWVIIDNLELVSRLTTSTMLRSARVILRIPSGLAFFAFALQWLCNTLCH